ncbi:Aste57867_25313 [Aphanomyces stellatus]|uniref:Aste57867_25313 protein n=1 Tax=Aphanomyces stellatus TaxID=120398 RepID=A0A485LTG8_9STRA|nr:hypothetical protein As57867_025235 [Aphanomyces stellatus]VFU01938.1 Aste57867_25313 [Aphanomyces stellatus]
MNAVPLVVGALLFALFYMYRRKKDRERARAAAGPLLLPNESVPIFCTGVSDGIRRHVGHLQGLKRDALEDRTRMLILLSFERVLQGARSRQVVSGICGFRNGKDLLDCILCHKLRRPFTLYGIPYTKGAFPKVHSCFNRIDLPVYRTELLMVFADFTIS